MTEVSARPVAHEASPAALDDWWEELVAATLVGSARRGVPAWPALPELAELAVSPSAGGPEVGLLDGVALGAALRRAGAAPRPVGAATPPADDDALRPPPATARQLLDLLLTQPPVGLRLTPRALRVWLTTAADNGFRVHHPALVPLLDRATATRGLREPVRPVLDSRGRWLAAANPTWAWAAAGAGPTGAADDADPVDPTTWARGSTAERAVAVRRLRATDPGAARALVESTWRTDPAPARAELLGALEVGLSLDDEPLLERALDDRAGVVREAAYRLLDRLPGSARAARMAAVLEPLLSVTGRVRRRVHVELPGVPDQAAVRDGLRPGRRGGSQRGDWLRRVVAAAPLESWTRTTGLDPAAVVAGLGDDDALAGLADAALGRRDADWARALLARVHDPRLARCLPPEEATTHLAGLVARAATVPELVTALRLAPGPWPEDVSAAVVRRLGRLPRAPHQLPELVDALADGLHPGTAAAVQRLAAATSDRPSDPLHQLGQYLSLVPAITEAFS